MNIIKEIIKKYIEQDSNLEINEDRITGGEYVYKIYISCNCYYEININGMTVKEFFKILGGVKKVFLKYQKWGIL